MKFRALALLSLAAAALCTAVPAAAQPYPSRPVTLVVPQAAGGTNDIVGRLVGQKLGELMNASVVVDNRPGAGGNIGTQLVAKGPKDGYTLLMTISSSQAINPALYKNPGFDPVKDFKPVGLVGAVPNVLLVHPSFPARDFNEFLKLARQKGANYQYASAGNGTLNHLLGEMLNSMAGISMQHVPYKGVAPALNDVLGGQLPIVFASLPSALSHIKAGKLRALAVSGEKRSPVLPDVPAIAEAVPGYNGTLWIGLFAPAGVPPEVLAKLQDATRKALAAKELRDKLEQQGVEIAAPTTPDQFSKLLQDDLAKWARIVKASGAAVD
ncbi:tripartite tricarboxylate transporter substrate binding protein [Variovorax sp. V59]|uniref:Tripartite-type tricarboxylate transporter receptor subunit TctC n=1 Tax=Variovorax paradoxus TaxID=34073 RepID=A0AAE3Y2P8_VARPD|nr:tripartite tricarboxylate transporter substrate binding protein [Variovorax paradoxus]MDP9963114.1 tripartite-type tricarboxylate transporter receptor subunit TctC [Variovorax paradoxus]MDR6428226.1 tripartite-type tricarboxylate transporter receptor subunit TctC [Variovorax paradoxus]